MDFRAKREWMVKTQLIDRGIKSTKVLKAMQTVPRHEFVPEKNRHLAYEDHPLPIGKGQTISQPYMVAYMSEVLQIEPGDEVLEIGFGCGYQTAVLLEMGARVYGLEIQTELVEKARVNLENLGLAGVDIRQGSAYDGWPESRMFTKILVAAAPANTPVVLTDQLSVGGRMVIPVGVSWQDLLLIRREKHGLEEEVLFPVRFVPLIE